MTPARLTPETADGAGTQGLPEMVDVAFSLSGESLPHGYEWPLFHEVARCVPCTSAAEG